MKVRISDICEFFEKPTECFPFIGLVKTSSNTTARIFDENPTTRPFQCLYPKIGVDIHYLCAILNKMNLTRFMKSLLITPRSFFQSYRNEEIDLPSIEEQKRASRVFEPIQRIIDIRNSQIETNYQLQKSIFIHDFGREFSNEQDPNWMQLRYISPKIMSDKSQTPFRCPELRDHSGACFFIDPKDDGSIRIKPPKNFHSYSIQVYTDIIEPDYLTFVLKNCFEFQTRQNWQIDDICDISVFCPPLAEQRRFLGKIQKVKKLIETMQKNVSQWELIYKSCLQKYLA